MNARERVLGGITAAVLGVAGVYSLLLEPAWTRWTEADQQARVLESALLRERAQADGLERVRGERAALDARLRPADADPATAFVAHARALTREAGFEPGTLRFLGARPLTDDTKRRGPRDEAAPFAELSFELRARTTLEKLTDFLVRLAASERPVRVAALGLTPRPGSADLEVDLSLVALAPADVVEQTRKAGRR